MKKILTLLVVLAFVCAVFFVFAGEAYSLDPEDPQFISAAPIFTKLKVPANIADHNLEAGLKIAAEVAWNETLYVEDLEALTGDLSLTHMGILDLSGIQHCKNVSRIFLDNNELSTLVNMSACNDLEVLSLDKNLFTTVPSHLYFIPHLKEVSFFSNPLSGFQIGITNALTLKKITLDSCAFTSFPTTLFYAPAIEEINISDNDIGSIPEGIIGMPQLTVLYANNCGLTQITDEIFGLTNLRRLSLGSNSISDLSKSIANLTKLEMLYIPRNDLPLLPSEITELTNLTSLRVDSNALTALPEKIGIVPLTMLSANDNMIEEIPKSICDSSKLESVGLRYNRIAQLPSNFADTNSDHFDISLNNLDISKGSKARNEIDNATGSDVTYLPQFAAPKNLVATAVSDRVLLSWNECPSGSYAESSMFVTGYTVYLKNGSVQKIAELPKKAQTYTHTGLSPQTDYTFRVTVKYHALHPGSGLDVHRSRSSEVSTSTTALPTDSPAPTTAQTESAITNDPVAAQTDASVETLPQTTAAAAEPGSNASAALPVWAIIAVCVGGALCLGAGGWLLWLWRKKRNKETPHQ